MRFQVPQFIEVENKVFGPLTIRQFIYLAGGGGLSYIFYSLLPFIAALVVVPVIIVIALLLAFYKVNERPFIYALEAAVTYFFKNKLYIWKKDTTKTNTEKNPAPQTQNNIPTVPKLSGSKLKDLAWSLDIKKQS